MDRTAWIAVILSAIGLVVWYSYMAKQTMPRPVVAGASPTPAITEAGGSVTPSASPSAAPSATPATQPAPSVAPFAEASETLRNDDVELHLTNRGGGIAEAVLLNHKAEHGPVILDSSDHLPIGATTSDPANGPGTLPEFKLRREGDAVVAEYAGPDNITIR